MRKTQLSNVILFFLQVNSIGEQKKTQSKEQAFALLDTVELAFAKSSPTSWEDSLIDSIVDIFQTHPVRLDLP